MPVSPFTTHRKSLTVHPSFQDDTYIEGIEEGKEVAMPPFDSCYDYASDSDLEEDPTPSTAAMQHRIHQSTY